MDTSLSDRKEDEFNRRKLRSLYYDSQYFIEHTLPPLFRDDLERWEPNFADRMKKDMDHLQTNKCVLLVAGETGAGKSSFINLLLGFELLPTGNLPCTATFVEISYGKEPNVRVSKQENGHGLPCDIRHDPLDSYASLEEKVKFATTYIDQSTDMSPFKTVYIEYPAQILQEGVVLVDCPSSSHYDGVSSQLSEYLTNSSGFIYVINSSDRVHRQNLTHMLLKSIELNYGFDETRCFFVSNHIDKISAKDRPQILKDINMNLWMILPEESRAQLHTISVRESLQSVKCGGMTPEHQQLMVNLRKLVPQARRARLRMLYRYVTDLLKRVLFSFRISENKTLKKNEELGKAYKEAEDRIKNREKDPKKKIQKIRSEINLRKYITSCEMIHYLNKIENRNRLTKWEEKDCPKKTLIRGNVLKQANKAIAERVAEAINAWVEESGFIKSLDDDIVQLFRDQFKLIDEEVTVLREVLNNGSEAKRFMMAVNGMNGSWNQRRQAFNKKKNLSSIGADVTSTFNFTTMSSSIADMFMKDYSSRPTAVMTQAAKLYLDTMTQNTNTVEGAMSKHFERILNDIHEIGVKVPKLIKADSKLLEDLKVDLLKGSKWLILLPEMETICKRLLGLLDMYYVERLIVTDFSTDQITCLELLGTGSFANVYKGILRHNGVTVNVALKVPLIPLNYRDVTDTLLEECMLRSLRHANIVHYFGMFKINKDDDVRLVFVMEYCPITLRKKCCDASSSPSDLKRVGKDPVLEKTAIMSMTKYVTQITKALVYLHHKAIVHRDLKPENVLLTDQDDVRIADLGLAKKVKDVSTCQIGTPVYMAPEVMLLQNVKFDTKVDIYSVAMIMWELWYGRDLSSYAKREIQCGLEIAIAKEWRPSLSIVGVPDSFWSHLIEQCWQQDPHKRPTASRIEEMLSLYSDQLQGWIDDNV